MIEKGIFPIWDKNEEKIILKVLNKNKGIEKIIGEFNYNEFLEIFYLLEKIYKEIIIFEKNEKIYFPNSKNKKFEISIDGKKIKIKKNGKNFLKISKIEFLNFKRRAEYILTKIEFLSLNDENNKNKIFSEKNKNEEKKNIFETIGEFYNEIKNYENIKLIFPEIVINNPKIFCKNLLPENWKEKMAPYSENEISEIFFIEKILNEKILKEYSAPILDFENNLLRNYFIWKLIFLPTINSKNYIPKFNGEEINKIVATIIKLKKSGAGNIFEKFWDSYQNSEIGKKIENSYLIEVFGDDVKSIIENLDEEIDGLYNFTLKEIENTSPENTEELVSVYKEINEKIPITVETILTKMIVP